MPQSVKSVAFTSEILFTSAPASIPSSFVSSAVVNEAVVFVRTVERGWYHAATAAVVA